MKINSKKTLFTLVIIIIILAGLLHLTPKAKDYVYRQKIEKENKATIELISEEDIIKKELPEETKEEPQPQPKPKTEAKIIASTEETELPKEAYLEVQFICQAPLQTEANWILHEESCEEAALLQAYNYEKGVEMTREEANEEILDMIDWQKENFDGHFDLYAEEVKKFAMGYYDLKNSEVKIIHDAEIEDIKEAIAGGHPVIVPITGNILNNPYYPYPGYHMLTVIGYTENRIITNDNGTRRGADFSYDTDVFEKAFKDAAGDIVILDFS